jgi:hypothetical protein
MHGKRNRRSQHSDGEATGESLQQHRPSHVEMLPENRHQDIHDSKDDATQNPDPKPIHEKVCTPANQKQQVRRRRCGPCGLCGLCVAGDSPATFCPSLKIKP